MMDHMHQDDQVIDVERKKNGVCTVERDWL